MAKFTKGMFAKRKYPAELSRPMLAPVLHQPGLLIHTLTPQQVAENDAAWNRHWSEAMRRLDVLREFYNVPAGGWAVLAMHLAIEFVPGLRVANKAGRPLEWPPFRIAQLRYEMDKIIESRGRGFSVESAAKVLVKRQEWKPRRPGRAPWEVLRRKYYEADLRWVEMLGKAELWDEYVKEHDEPISSCEEMAPR